MAKRSIDGPGGLPPGGLPPGGVGEGGIRPRDEVKFDDFDLDIRFGTGEFGEGDFVLLTACVCLGGTQIDTVGGATCVQLCALTRTPKLCVIVDFDTFWKRTCGHCITVRTCLKKATCLTCGTCFGCGGGGGTNPPECG